MRCNVCKGGCVDSWPGGGFDRFEFFRSEPALFVEKERCWIVASAKGCSKIALFVNPSVDEVEDVLSEIEVDGLQFHGDEDSRFCESFGLDYIKAISMKEIYSPKELEEYHPNIPENVKFENPSKKESDKGYENFVVIRCHFDELDYLKLKYSGHLRCKLIFENENINAVWLAP